MNNANTAGKIYKKAGSPDSHCQLTIADSRKRTSMIKKLITISICATLVCSAARAQYDADKVNKKAKALFEKAYGIAMNGNYNESIKTLQDAIKIEPRFLEAFLSIAGLYFEQKNYQGAIENYEKAKDDEGKHYNLNSVARKYNSRHKVKIGTSRRKKSKML